MVSVSTGTCLGRYEILAQIGRGGMGEVFKARDTILGRTVAIKILPDDLASDRGRSARLQREAKIISRLNHPHICNLYDTGSEDGTDFLVMEYLEGQTLSDRLLRGALPLREAITVAIEVAEALDAAHREGIVHRDVKPANIVLTKSGAKLLDFGVARDSSVGRQSETSTAQKSLTREGALIGTVPYMAPEQIRGHRADARTDIFALGAVLYEMITGRSPFPGETHAELMAAIAGTDAVALRSRQPLAPRELENVVMQCLAKDPDRRRQSAWDVAEELRFIAEARSEEARQVSHIRAWKIAALSGTVAAIALSAAMVIGVLNRPRPKPMRLHFTPPPEANVVNPSRRPIAVSPDGEQIAFLGGPRSSVWVASITTGSVSEIEGTNFADTLFWSPDGRFVTFNQNGRLKKVGVEAGAATTIAPSLQSPAWARNGALLCSKGSALYLLSRDGGPPRLVHASKDVRYRYPVFLADGEHYLIDRVDRERNVSVVVRRLGEEGEQVVVRDARNAMWTDTGHLLFVRGGKLMGQRFDLHRFKTMGEPAVLSESVWRSAMLDYAMYSASRNGKVLVFHRDLPLPRLVHVDLDGNIIAELSSPRRARLPTVSHDGLRVAYTETQPDGNEDIWTMDLTRRVAARLTSTPSADGIPIWSPDDDSIAYRCDRSLCVVSSAGGSPTVYGSTGVPSAWSPDGRVILTWKGNAINALHLSDGHVEPVVQGRFTARWARFSPDGRWIAYHSDESGTEEIYVQRYPDGAFKTRISTSGGDTPVWSRDGTKIYYGSVGFHAVDIAVGPKGVRAPLPRPILERLPAANDFFFSEMADGRSVVGFVTPAESTYGGLEVLINWTSLIP